MKKSFSLRPVFGRNLQPLAGLGLALLLAVFALPLRAATPVTQLKVMSFNIWVSGGLSLSNCIEVIRTSGADIVGLQECNAATAQTIATRLGFFVQPDGDASIVSRYPILNAIPASGGRGAAIELGPGQRVYFFNCHLTAYPYGPYNLKAGQSQSFIVNQENTTRMPGMTNLLNAMSPYVAGSEPCFLVGDFNAPSHLDYASFPWPTSLACETAGLLDSYRETHPGNRKFPAPFAYNEPGITWTPQTNQEPEAVFDRIDFVLYSAGDGMGVVSSGELDGRNSISPWPSDDRAVLSTLTLTPPTPTTKASAPIPANNGTGVDLNPTLSWLPGLDAVAHDVYFGTANPPPLVTNLTDPPLPLANLLPDTTYFWRVDELTGESVITGDVWSFTTKRLSTDYEWDFATGDFTPALGDGVLDFADAATLNFTTFGVTDGATVPHIGGQPATYLHVPVQPALGNGYHVTLTSSGPNGNGAYLNRFTIIMDLLLPGAINWTALFNTNPSNGNDADWYVHPNGGLGIADLGYSASGAIAPNTWYRIAFVADLGAGVVKYFVNGTLVRTRAGASILDGRFSLYSNADPGPDLLFFNEGDTSGNYTHELYLNSLFITDRTLTDAEITALGGPKARGIAVSAPPIRVSLAADGPDFTLNWIGGEGPFLVQRTPSLTNPDWQAIGPAQAGTSRTVTRDGATSFYRVITP